MSDSKLEVLALIPARGGSRSIPRKNVVELGGHPLIYYSIEQAIQSQQISRVIVTTDDDEIAKVALESGAEVPFKRPGEFATDTAQDYGVFRHALEWLEEHESYVPDLVVHLRPTGPIRKVELIDQAIGMMLANPDADSLRSMSPAELTPYKMWQFDGVFASPVIVDPENSESHSAPRQSLPPVYWQNGYVDVIRPRTVMDLNSMAGKHVLPFVVSEPIYELDYPDDIPGLVAALTAKQASDSTDSTTTNSSETRHAR
jgi:CMP-N,N'-diacetyllegionaminic acid synthase